MRGWSCKEAAGVLNIAPTKVTKALFSDDSAMDKVARLMVADPHKTMVDLLVHMTRVKARASRGSVSISRSADELWELAAAAAEARRA